MEDFGKSWKAKIGRERWVRKRLEEQKTILEVFEQSKNEQRRKIIQIERRTEILPTSTREIEKKFRDLSHSILELARSFKGAKEFSKISENH